MALGVFGSSEASGVMMSTTYQIFVSCLPRFEVLLDQELQALVPSRKRARKQGGVELRVDRGELWSLAHDLRVAESIRVRVGAFHAPDFRALRLGLARLPWSAWVGRSELPPVEVSTSSSALYHDVAVQERVEQFFLERAEASDAPKTGLAPRVFVRIVNDAAVVSVDASGALLHRRGVRTTTLRAPLRETIAAACLRASGLQGSMQLADPVCGSGVFLVERAMSEPGAALPRWFAFETWPTHEADEYASWTYARPPLQMPDGLSLFGADNSAAAVDACRDNLQRIIGGEAVPVEKRDIADTLAALPPGTDVIMNPPWGERVSGSARVGAAVGQWLRRRPKADGGRVAVLVNGHEFLKASGERWDEVLAFRDGGLPVRLMVHR